MQVIRIFIYLLITGCWLLVTGASRADPGIIVEAKGKVTIAEGGKSVNAQTGTQFREGAKIIVASGGSATLMFNNGATKKLASGEKYTAVKAAGGKPAGTPLIKGIAMAYNDATRASKGPTVHGMVKVAPARPAGGPGQKGATEADAPLSPERAKQMQADLNQINALGLGGDGRALMQAQVYYKYQQNGKMVNILLPVYKSQHPPSDMVKNLLALGYEKMGKPDEAARYR